MTRAEQITRKKEREVCLAKLLMLSIQQRQERVATMAVMELFPDSIAFNQAAHFFFFLERLSLNINKPGQGKDRLTEIEIDINCLKFVATTLNKSFPQLVDYYNQTTKRTGGYLTHTEFQKLHDSIPEFTPMGDPVFSLTRAPRMHVND